MTKRQDIRTAIISRLNGITIANGFNNDIGLVSRQLKGHEAVTPDLFPAAFVVNEDEKKVDGDVDDLENSLQVQITCYVQDDEDTTNKLDLFLEDIEKAICPNTDRDLGDSSLEIINILPLDIKTDKGVFTPIGIADFTFQIKYLQRYGTP